MSEKLLAKVLSNSGQKLYVIKDRTNAVRWVFPNSLKAPLFLNLYNSKSLKSKLYRIVVGIAFKLGFKRGVVSGEINGELQDKFSSILEKIGCTSYTVFMGTPGENRKLVLEANDGRVSRFFIKIPTTESALSLIKNECYFLEKIQSLKPDFIIAPKIAHSDDDCIAISNIKPLCKVERKTELISVHIKALISIYEKTSRNITHSNGHFYNEVMSKLDSVNLEKDCAIDKQQIKSLVSNIGLIRGDVNDREVKVSLAHGDFTPWNMYVTQSVIYVYDWELGREDAPLLFDFFHYIFQSEVLINHSKYPEIKYVLNKYLYKETMKKLLRDFEINFEEYYGHYLVYIVGYYLPRYIDQEDLHEQAHWLIDTWYEAINDFLSRKGGVFGTP